MILALLIMVLIGSSLGALYLYSHQDSPAPTNQVIGYGDAAFISAAPLNEGTTQGLNNELQINLSNIPNPPPGKSYYAWLFSDKNRNPVISLVLGKLHVNSGSVTFLYPGDSQHTDLLATYSRLLITEEDLKSIPWYPSTGQSTRSYYAELPQKPNASGKALDHLRFLLSDDPHLQQLGIDGGLISGLYKNMQQVVGWADSISNSNDPAVIRRLVISILDYVDGAPYAQEDVPPGTPLMVDPTLSQVPITSTEQSQIIPSYLARINDQLSSLIYSPGVTPETKVLAAQIKVALYNLEQTQLKQVRKDAKQLVNMSDTQLLQPLSKLIIIDMQTQAHNAFYGHIDAKGITQLSAEIQSLATFDIALYKP